MIYLNHGNKENIQKEEYRRFVDMVPWEIFTSITVKLLNFFRSSQFSQFSAIFKEIF